MAVTLSSLMYDALHNPERYGALLYTFSFGPNVYGLWTREGEKQYNGIIYRAGGSVLELDPIEFKTDGSVTEMNISLSAAPDKGLTVDILQTFYQEQWQFGQVSLQLALLDPNTLDPIGVIPIMNGVAQEAPYVQGDGQDKIVLRITSNTIKLSENGGSYRNNVTQRLIDPTDSGYEGIGTFGGNVSKGFYWGQA